MDFAPFASVFSPIFLAFPLAFTQTLDVRAVHQQVQRGLPRLVDQLHLQILLASADGVEVWDPPVQSSQLQKASDHAQRLEKGLAERALDAQAELDSHIQERLIATPAAIGLGHLLHTPVQPHSQRFTGLKRCVVLGPAGRAVAAPHLLAFAHLVCLTAKRFALCNKAAQVGFA